MDATSTYLPDKFSELARSAPPGRLSPEYREIVDATVALLEDYRKRTQLEVFGLPCASPDDFFASIKDNLWREWRAIWSDAVECLSDLRGDIEHVAAAKRYTETHVTSRLLDAPLWRQAYAKPLGYAGDYAVMNFIYEGVLRGKTPFAQLAHALAIKIGEFVVRRKDLVHDAIAQTVTRLGSTQDVTIASLGCGPAREIADFAGNGVCADAPISFVLLDQDEQALRFAGRSVAAALDRRRDGPPIRIDLRKISVLRLLRDFQPRDMLSPVDMIYSAGLFDYFSDRTCRILAQRLYDALRPGGLLLLGNMKAGTDMPWPLDYIANWTLTYRTAEGVMSWAERLPGAEISLRTEATGYDYLLAVRKRG
jgi:extracellular factor (EF) 3-hydroxypalmitic acid methyl ester biosynthesis protein